MHIIASYMFSYSNSQLMVGTVGVDAACHLSSSRPSCVFLPQILGMSPPRLRVVFITDFREEVTACDTECKLCLVCFDSHSRSGIYTQSLELYVLFF